MRDATRTFPRSLLRHLNSIPGTQNLEYAYRFIEPPLWQLLPIQSLRNSLLQLNYGFQKPTAPGSSLSSGHLLRICVYVLSCSGRIWLFATPCPPGSSVRGIFQARILDRVAISFSRESSQPRDLPASLASAGRFFTESQVQHYNTSKSQILSRDVSVIQYLHHF